MNSLQIEKNINIEDLIYNVRGKQVMLDSDLAKLYKCTNGTKDINKAVNRNINRFPEDFYFQLTDKEMEFFWFQFGTKKIKTETRGGRYKNPKVFTEQGVAMLASVLHTEIAIETSVKIMRSFIKMRRYFANSNEMLLNHENRLLVLEEALDKFKEKEIDKIFFEGELYDSYSLLIDILNKSKIEIIIIDNYAGKEFLDIIKNIDRKIIIVSKNIDFKLKEKYESQYSNASFINNDSFHDRFIIIDRKILYSCGASFKDLGKKCFSINQFDDSEYLTRLLEKINI